jgi:hypothetical protein
MTLPLPGLRHLVYLAGHQFSRPPVQFGRLRPGVLEAVRRVASGKAVRDVAIPYAGAPVRPTRYVFTVGWDTFSSADAEAFERAIADDLPTDFCPWMSRAETFRFVSGEPYAGVLQRRDAYSECPLVPSVTTGLEPRLEIDGVAATITLGAIDSEYRQAWSAPGLASAASEVTIWYMPLYRVYLTESDEQPDIPQRLVASCVLTEV